MTNTITAFKTGYRVVYLQKIKGIDPFEHVGLTTFETFQEAFNIGCQTAFEMCTENRQVELKYIIAVPLVGQVEV
jgi:hypothetical protein